MQRPEKRGGCNHLQLLSHPTFPQQSPSWFAHLAVKHPFDVLKINRVIYSADGFYCGALSGLSGRGVCINVGLCQNLVLNWLGQSRLVTYTHDPSMLTLTCPVDHKTLCRLHFLFIYRIMKGRCNEWIVFSMISPLIRMLSKLEQTSNKHRNTTTHYEQPL